MNDPWHAHPVTEPDTVFGFDVAADGDTSMVVMHRGADGRWQIQTTTGPDSADLARMAAQIFETYEPPPQRRKPTAWGEWLAEHAGKALPELDDWQHHLVDQAYTRLIREGKLSHQAPSRS